MSNTSSLESGLTIVPCVISDATTSLEIAFNVHKTIEVLEVQEYSKFPISCAPFIGVIDYHHQSIPILDLRQHILGGNFSEIHAGRVIICQFNQLTVGVLVQKTKKLEKIKSDGFLPAPELPPKHEYQFFLGVIKSQARDSYLIDLEGIMESLGIQITDETQESKDINLFAGKSVLILEDSKLYAKKIISLLQSLNMKYDHAPNGQEGLHYVRNQSYDVIFCDVEMPIMNGLEFARVVKRERLTSAPLIFNTSLSTPSIVELIENEALGTYLRKYDEHSIVKAFAAALTTNTEPAGDSGITFDLEELEKFKTQKAG